ncbi:hypothetical protein [Pseudolactococcus insecticola]|uniref:Uncharacterized protein n=1 Tax=Pseudolactococcus insecticola TaxID=2709158 RepID=A0A6A0B732_9LACT|nr:hypothetical protein [Lactococcus insecticola]GFH40575.1 hypothetical protein Hs20B_09730 [Lactococcus insecticola]
MPVDYDNASVLAKFAENYPDFKQEEINYVFDILENLRTDFLAMSPLEWQVTPEAKAEIAKNPPTTAGIHVRILVVGSECVRC